MTFPILAAAGADANPGAAGVAALAGLFAVVGFGAVLPVVPTGAAVSGSAAFAWHEHWFLVALSVLAGAAGAYLGDLVVFLLCRRGGRALAARMRWLRDDEHLAVVQHRLRQAPVPVLLVSRLLPGGRVPVLLAAAFAGLDVRLFLVANASACLLWASAYAALGVAGGSLFPEPWQGVAAAVAVVVALAAVPALLRRSRGGGVGSRPGAG